MQLLVYEFASVYSLFRRLRLNHNNNNDTVQAASREHLWHHVNLLLHHILKLLMTLASLSRHSLFPQGE